MNSLVIAIRTKNIGQKTFVGETYNWDPFVYFRWFRTPGKKRIFGIFLKKFNAILSFKFKNIRSKFCSFGSEMNRIYPCANRPIVFICKVNEFTEHLYMHPINRNDYYLPLIVLGQVVFSSDDEPARIALVLLSNHKRMSLKIQVHSPGTYLDLFAEDVVSEIYLDRATQSFI